jgi:hypothetical protein
MLSKPATRDKQTQMEELTVSQTLTLLHARPDSFTVLMNRNSVMHTLGAIRPTEITDNPLLQPYFKGNFYFSIHSFYDQGKYWKDIWRHKETNLPLFRRKERYLSSLNAAVVDLDANRPGQPPLSFDDLLRMALERVDERRIPEPSLVVDSGRGIWLLWLLRNYQGQPGVAVSSAKLLYFKRVNHALFEAFRDFNADHAKADSSVKDGARIMRVPGSLNTAANRPVRFYLLSQTRYKLLELGTPLGVDEHLERRAYKSHRKVVDEVRSAAARTRWARDGDAVINVGALRGGYKKGHRRIALYYLAAYRRKQGQKELDVKSEMRDLAGKCRPPVDLANVIDVYAQASKNEGWIKRQTLICDLQFNVAEIKTAWTDYSPVKIRRTRAQRNAAAAAVVAKRRQFLEVLIGQHPEANLKDLAISIQREGYSVSISTLKRDMRSIISVVTYVPSKQIVPSHDAVPTDHQVRMRTRQYISNTHTDFMNPDTLIGTANRGTQSMVFIYKRMHPQASLRELAGIMGKDGHKISKSQIARCLKSRPEGASEINFSSLDPDRHRRPSKIGHKEGIEVNNFVREELLSFTQVRLPGTAEAIRPTGEVS